MWFIPVLVFVLFIFQSSFVFYNFNKLNSSALVDGFLLGTLFFGSAFCAFFFDEISGRNR